MPETTTLMSVEEYLSSSFEEGDCDFVEGELWERNLGEISHSDVQGRLYAYLISHYPAQWTGVEVRVQVSDRKYLVPDVTMLAGPKPATRRVETVPLVVAEVLSPEDRMARTERKIQYYLDFGVTCVWLINPESRRCYLYTRDSIQEVKDGVMRVPGTAVQVPVSALFD